MSGFTIQLPPLRERPADVPPLLDYFLRRFAVSLDKDVRGIAPQTLEVLLRYRWPGNVRELQNVVRQALLSTVGPVLLPEFLPAAVNADVPTSGENRDNPNQFAVLLERLLNDGGTNIYSEAVAAMDRYVLSHVLTRTQGNLSHAAKILGITRGSLRNKIRSLGLSIDRQIKVDDIADEDDETCRFRPEAMQTACPLAPPVRSAGRRPFAPRRLMAEDSSPRRSPFDPRHLLG